MTNEEPALRVAVFGTGGVGGYFGARLASAGVDVTFIARGAHLEAIRKSGLKIDSVLGDVHVQPARATDSTAAVGPVDGVLLGVKTWQVPDAVRALPLLLGADTYVVPLQNGIETPDLLVDALGAKHVVGGTCGGFAFVAEPGRIRHIGGATFIKFGELNGDKTERVEALRDAFARADVDVEVPADIRVSLWEKMLLVVPFGGVGAVTRAPIGVLMSVPRTRRMVERGIEEVEALARARRIALPANAAAKAIATLESVTPAGTSSLQRDIVAGKPSELEAWVGSVVRLAAESGVAVPLHEYLYASLLPLELRARGELRFG
jgi:2-dehydropantoate 2-reductase